MQDLPETIILSLAHYYEIKTSYLFTQVYIGKETRSGLNGTKSILSSNPVIIYYTTTKLSVIIIRTMFISTCMVLLRMIIRTGKQS